MRDGEARGKVERHAAAAATSLDTFDAMMASLRDSLWDPTGRSAAAPAAPAAAPASSGRIAQATLQKELAQFRAVAAHPVFAENPLGTLQLHLANKLRVEQEAALNRLRTESQMEKVRRKFDAANASKSANSTMKKK